MTRVRLASTPPLVVAAAAVVCSRYTTHGCRPTSVTTQPHSMATIAATPLTVPAAQNTRCAGSRRRRHHSNSAHSPRSRSRNPSPTMTSKHRWISHTAGGRSAGETLSQPVTRVPGPNPASSESRSGIFTPA